MTISPRLGIRVFAAWSAILTLLALAHMLLLTRSVELYSNIYGNQSIIWVIFLFNLGFALGFGLTTYGLWQQKSWGRVLFLYLIGVWAGFNLVSLLLPNLLLGSSAQTAGQLALNGLRYAASLVIPLWYFNLPRIKIVFYTGSQSNAISEDN